MSTPSPYSNHPVFPAILDPSRYDAWIEATTKRPATLGPTAARAAAPDNYARETERVWATVAQQARRLDDPHSPERAKRQQVLDQLITETLEHLAHGGEVVDWALLDETPVMAAIHRQLGLSPTWTQAHRIVTAKTLLKVRTLYYHRHDNVSGYSCGIYRLFPVDEQAIRNGSLSAELPFANCSGIGKQAVGFFDRCGRPLGFTPLGGSPSFSVLGHANYDLPGIAVTPGFAAYATAEADLSRRLVDAMHHVATPTTRIDWEAARRRWDEVIIAPESLTQLLRGWLLFAHSHKAAPRGILLKGPPGTGKSLIAQTFAQTSGCHFIELSAADLKGEFIGQSGKNITRLWNEARTKQPAIIFLDECEGVLARRGSDQGDGFTNEMVQAFLSQWDGIKGSHAILVIGATNKAELLDDAVMSRFTDVFELLPVSAKYRPALIRSVARQVGMTGPIDATVVEGMGGMSGRDVRSIMHLAMREAAPDEPGPEHFGKAISRVRGKSRTRTDAMASWDTLVLPQTVKQELMVICRMVKDAEAMAAKNIPLPRTLLLCGPPGVGKTQIARTIANEAGIGFIAQSTASLKAQFLGHAANRVREAFATARANSPCILFVDEIDTLTSSRGEADALQEEATAQLLQELDGVADQGGFVLVVGATNRASQMDPAILSRFGRRIKIGLPDEGERAAILHTLLQGRPVAGNVNVLALAQQSTGCSGRDLRELVTQGFQKAVARAISQGKPASSAMLQPADLEAKSRSVNGYGHPSRPLSRPDRPVL